jgi:hypothetical protein
MEGLARQGQLKPGSIIGGFGDWILLIEDELRSAGYYVCVPDPSKREKGISVKIPEREPDPL